MKKESGRIIYSPSDLIRYLDSPFASWFERYHLENPRAITPDPETDQEKVLSRAGDEHEQAVLNEYKAFGSAVVQVAKDDDQFDLAYAATLKAIRNQSRIIYQAALRNSAIRAPRRFCNTEFNYIRIHGKAT